MGAMGGGMGPMGGMGAMAGMGGLGGMTGMGAGAGYDASGFGSAGYGEHALSPCSCLAPCSTSRAFWCW
jgi:hypothetical protein